MIFQLLIVLFLVVPAFADTYSASGMLMSNTCYPVARCTTVAVSPLNTSTVRGTADFLTPAMARVRRIDELTVIAAARIAAVQESSTLVFSGGSGQYSTARIATYTTQTNATLTAATTYINGTLATTTEILDYVPQWPRF